MADSGSKSKRSPTSTFLMVAAGAFVLLIMFDQGMREAAGDTVQALFTPVISLWGGRPLYTILFASLVMIITTTILRHYLVDWIHMARVQEVMRTFQREFADARKSNNTYKIKRLTEIQPEIMKMQTDLSMSQFKPMGITMLIVIPIFAFLSQFVGGLAPAGGCAPGIHMPWNPDWTLGAPYDARSTCPEGWAWFLPHWILLYSFFSIPFGFVTQKVLKLWEYSRADVNDDGTPAGAKTE